MTQTKYYFLNQNKIFMKNYRHSQVGSWYTFTLPVVWITQTAVIIIIIIIKGTK